jgi:hypothetical protein
MYEQEGGYQKTVSHTKHKDRQTEEQYSNTNRDFSTIFPRRQNGIVGSSPFIHPTPMIETQRGRRKVICSFSSAVFVPSL